MINTLIKNSSLKGSLLAVALGCGLSASAQTITTSTNFPVGLEIPDDAPSGLASSKIVSTPIAYITKVKATLKLSGTWNGDMYCYLVHSSGRTVLLNRAGRRAGSSLGYGDEGFDVTFDDAANDIHKYRLQVTGDQSVPITGVLTNVWAFELNRFPTSTLIMVSARLVEEHVAVDAEGHSESFRFCPSLRLLAAYVEMLQVVRTDSVRHKDLGHHGLLLVLHFERVRICL